MKNNSFVIFAFMKKMIVALFASSAMLAAQAQNTEKEKELRTVNADTSKGWKTGGMISLNLAQTQLVNWAAGGQNTIAINGLLSTYANLKKGKSSWDNSLDVGYGMLQQGKGTSFIKTDDKIDLSSKYGQLASKHWYYAALLNFKTQMAPGYNYPNDSVMISNLLAPGYLLGALGMDYKPSDNFNLFLAPLTAKVTIVNDEKLADAGAFGVDKATYDGTGKLISHGKRVRNEFGGYLRMQYKRNLMENISFSTRLEMFSNYLENPQNIDISWETILTMKVNKYISATLTTHLLYDNDIKIAVDKNNDGVTDAVGPRTQFKEVLGVGFSYKF